MLEYRNPNPIWCAVDAESPNGGAGATLRTVPAESVTGGPSVYLSAAACVKVYWPNAARKPEMRTLHFLYQGYE